MSSNIFIFNKTSYSSTNPKSFINHVRFWCKTNGENLNETLKLNYIHYNGIGVCNRCGRECEYHNFKIGVLPVCYSSECYKKFIELNTDYYLPIASNKNFFDMYDNTEYYTSFNKIYYNRVKQKFNLDFNKICVVCNKSIPYISTRSKTCSKECRYALISKVRLNNFIEDDEYGWIVDQYDLSNNEYIKKLNHYINYLGDTSKFPKRIKNLIIGNYYFINPKDKICYYSEKYDLYFYSRSSKNTLRLHIGKEYESYHKKYHSKCFKCCNACGKEIFEIDVFGNSINSKTYCNALCYWEGIKLGHYPVSDESREAQSNTLRRKIQNGEFTPYATNSWCKSRVVIDSVPYRSSWDAAFGILNKNYEYEKLRIPYTIDNKLRIYIVDFIDDINKIVVEIKPSCYVNDEVVIEKRKKLLDFCSETGYTYIEVDEKWFNENINLSDIELLKSTLNEKVLKNFLNGIKYYENIEN